MEKAKTYKVRPFTVHRRELPMIQVAAAADAIPLKSEDWAERWCTIPATLERVLQSVLDFEVRPQDVFVVTFIKCGTTWMQATAWLLMNNLDYEKANKTSLLDRSVYLELSGLLNFDSTIEKCNRLPSPRLIKSHMPANLLPRQLWEKKQKIIYVARNVKDVVVSSYHYLKGMGAWSGNIDEYVEDFMNNEIRNAPFWAHVVDFWKMRNEPFIFFVTFEEMKRNLGGVVQRLCKFLDRAELTEAELKVIQEFLSFDRMKVNKQEKITKYLKNNLNVKLGDDFQFMRRGIVGSYNDELTPELQEKLNTWSRDYLSKHNIKEEDIFGTI